jgi:uncharacterized protein (DUF1697 family)
MPVYVAFLRAINVGGHTVKMDTLRTLFEEMGFSQVETFIASGNVIFTSRAAAAHRLETRIAAHLEQALGYAVDTFVRTLAETAEIETHCPFAAGSGWNVYVALLHAPPDTLSMQALMALKNRSNDFAIRNREIYWLRLDKDDAVFLKRPLEKVIGLPATVRKLTTVSKLVKKYR